MFRFSLKSRLTHTHDPPVCPQKKKNNVIKDPWNPLVEIRKKSEHCLHACCINIIKFDRRSIPTSAQWERKEKRTIFRILEADINLTVTGLGLCTTFFLCFLAYVARTKMRVEKSHYWGNILRRIVPNLNCLKTNTAITEKKLQKVLSIFYEINSLIYPKVKYLCRN